MIVPYIVVWSTGGLPDTRHITKLWLVDQTKFIGLSFNTADYTLLVNTDLASDK